MPHMNKEFVKKIKIQTAPLLSLLVPFLPFLLLTLFWVLTEITVNPFGEFPFVDDWMYSRCVYVWVTKGKFWLCDFQAVTLFAQAAWGALFALIFGFSMTALRFSVLLLGWFGSLMAYRMFREAPGSRGLSFFAALTFAATPFYVLLSNTFMTDVPFVALTVSAFIFLMRWIRDEKAFDLVLGLLFACAASLVRQLALVIPFSFSLAYLFKNEFKKKSFLVGVIACGAVAGTLWVYRVWLESFGGVPYMLASKQSVFTDILKTILEPSGAIFFRKLLWAFLVRFCVVWIYLGVFLFPFLLIVFPVQWKGFSIKERWLGSAGALLFLAGVIACLLDIHRIMPLGMPLLYDFGLGNETCMSGETLFTPKAPVLFWQVVTGVGLLGGGWLVLHIVVALKRLFKALVTRKDLSAQWGTVLCFSAICIHFFPYGISGHFDRYQLFYIPLVLFWIIQSCGSMPRLSFRSFAPLAWILLIIVGFFSIAATHDCLTQNRTRWGVLRYLMNEGKISPFEIDGGYEFNGWYTYDPNYRKKASLSWWWVADDKYRVTSGPIPGYSVLFQAAYVQWMPPRKRSIFALKRIAEKRLADTGPSKTVYEF